MENIFSRIQNTAVKKCNSNTLLMKKYNNWRVHQGISEEFWFTIVRPTVLKKHNYKCFECGATKGLDIHHTSYEEQTINNLIPLCRPCHRKHDGEVVLNA